MSGIEIEEMTAYLREQLADEIAPTEGISVEEASKDFARAVEAINGINPKNLHTATLAIAPTEWKLVIEEGVAAILYRERAAILAESDPLRSEKYAVFARLHQKQFEQLATLLMQVRPTSAGRKMHR